MVMARPENFYVKDAGLWHKVVKWTGQAWQTNFAHFMHTRWAKLCVPLQKGKCLRGVQKVRWRYA